MLVEDFKGYREGDDLTMIPPEYLTVPSKNCIVYKGKIVSRGGTKNDGTPATVNEKIHSEYTWKKAPNGTKYLRCFGQTVQVKYNGVWITIFTGLDASTTRVRFASWTDTNGSIIKNRLFFVDGGENVYEWNGGIMTVESVATNELTFSDEYTPMQSGFDAGNVTPKNIWEVNFTGGVVSAITSNTYSDALAGATMTLATTPAVVAGSLVISKVTVNTTILTGIEKNEIYEYKNQLYVASLRSGRIYYSDAEDYLNFTPPSTITAISAGLLDLDGLFTAIIARKDVLWISTEDDWYKITKTVEANAYGYWTDVEKFEQAESKGAKPYAVAINDKGDVIYMAEDKQIRTITSLEIVGTDDIQLMSEEVEGMFLRYALEDVRIYYHQRYIFIISVKDSVLFMLDTIGDPARGVTHAWQPPQELPISCMSIIDGVRYGHSNGRNETFELFTGRNDYGAQIETVIAPAYVREGNPFKYSQHSVFGIHARATELTTVKIEHLYEESGAKAQNLTEFDVANVKTYDLDNDVSYGTNPWATRSLAGIDDMEDGSLKPFFVFDRYNLISYFNYRPIFYVTGQEMEFHLLRWYVDSAKSDMGIGNDLFISK